MGKKNMRVGSVKSMDELCQPIVKKVEDKMVWVPPDFAVTPEIVCKTMDQIKAEFPEHAKTMSVSEAAKKKTEDAEEAAKKQLAEKAKVLVANMEKDLSAILKKAGGTASKELTDSFHKHLEQDLGGEMDKRKEKMISKVLETITLGIRGLETKAKQKSDESINEWLVNEAREQAKARKKEADAKTDL